MISKEMLHNRGIETIDTLIILGSGMSGCYMPDEYEIVAEAGGTAVIGHTGRVTLLRHGDRISLLALGRRHLYEGYGVAGVRAIVHEAAALGARNLIVTNAAGGLNPRFNAGDVMLIEDYMGTMLGGRMAWEGSRRDNGDSPDNLFIPRHRDGPFATGLYPEIERRALAQGLALQRGIYAGVPGPSYETRAEIRMLRRMGGDAVGMSTIPEVSAALAHGMRVIGLSLITNILTDTDRVMLDHLDVVEQGKIAQVRMRLAIDAATAIMKPL